MKLLNRLAQTLERSFTNTARTHTRELLLRQSDRSLEDSGFSRALLEQGNKAWPWRVDDDIVASTAGIAPIRSRFNTATANTAGVSGASAGKRERQAIAELNTYSDAELADLGLSRIGIVDAVRYGRPGLDQKAA